VPTATPCQTALVFAPPRKSPDLAKESACLTRSRFCRFHLPYLLTSTISSLGRLSNPAQYHQDLGSPHLRLLHVWGRDI